MLVGWSVDRMDTGLVGCLVGCVIVLVLVGQLGKTSIEKKRFLSRIAQMRGWGGLPMPEFFGPFSRSAFLVNKKRLFLQKCQFLNF